MDDLVRVDWSLSSFLAQLSREGLSDRTSVVLVGDHGMADGGRRTARHRQLAEFTDVR